MARERGVFNFSGNLEVKKEAALDARLYVPTFAELTQASTWQDDDGNVWLYNTMVVGVGSGASAALYMLTDKTKYTQASAWVKLTTGGDLPEPESDVYMIGDLSEIDADSASSITAAQIQEMLGTPAQVTEAMTAGKVFVGKYGGLNMLFQPMATASNVQIVGQAFSDMLSFTFRKNTAGTAWQNGVMYSNKQAVTSVEGNGAISVEDGDTGDIGLSLKLDSSGNVTLTQSTSGLKASYDDPMTGVLSSDKVLALNGKNITATVGLAYVSETKKINLTGKGGTVIASIDASDFIKDGMVDSVELSGNNLVITFNTSAGKEPISVDLSKFLDVYTAGAGIAVSGKTISVKVDSSTEKYLTVGAGGLKVSGITADIAAAEQRVVTQAKTYTDTQDADFLEQAKTYAQSLFQWHDVGE